MSATWKTLPSGHVHSPPHVPVPGAFSSTRLVRRIGEHAAAADGGRLERPAKKPMVAAIKRARMEVDGGVASIWSCVLLRVLLSIATCAQTAMATFERGIGGAHGGACPH